MAIIKRASSQALVLAGVLLAGCAMDGGDGLFTTGSLSGQQAAADQKADATCVTLATRIESLRKDGIPDKIEKAAAKRYKMTQADLGKADQLTKANAEFQVRCSTVKPTVAEATPAESAATVAAAKKAAKASATKTP
jgi:hypothetical protein